MIIAIVGVAHRIPRAISNPDIAGKLTSVTTTSKASGLNTPSASSALDTAKTSRAGCDSHSQVTSRTSGLSSTYRIRSGLCDMGGLVGASDAPAPNAPARPQHRLNSRCDIILTARLCQPEQPQRHGVRRKLRIARGQDYG